MTVCLQFVLRRCFFWWLVCCCCWFFSEFRFRVGVRRYGSRAFRCRVCSFARGESSLLSLWLFFASYGGGWVCGWADSRSDNPFRCLWDRSGRAPVQRWSAGWNVLVVVLRRGRRRVRWGRDRCRVPWLKKARVITFCLMIMNISSIWGYYSG